jgi:hypothetical protein
VVIPSLHDTEMTLLRSQLFARALSRISFYWQLKRPRKRKSRRERLDRVNDIIHDAVLTNRRRRTLDRIASIAWVIAISSFENFENFKSWAKKHEPVVEQLS